MDLYLYFGLFRTYKHGKQRLGPLYLEIGSDRPIAGVSTYRSWILPSVNSERSYRAPCVVLVINDNPYGLMIALSYMCRTCP
jgi:hypothetical protein